MLRSDRGSTTVPRTPVLSPRLVWNSANRARGDRGGGLFIFMSQVRHENERPCPVVVIRSAAWQAEEFDEGRALTAQVESMRVACSRRPHAGRLAQSGGDRRMHWGRRGRQGRIMPA
jgi:hypothetical protein